MDSSLELVSPQTHYIYSDLDGDNYSRPLCGSVIFRPSYDFVITNSTLLRTQLVRIVQSKISQSCCQGQGLLGRMRRQFVANAKQAGAGRTCSAIEEVTCPLLPFFESQRDDSSREGAVINVPFSILMPANMPASTTTSQGTVSYAILASVITPECTIFSTSQTIHLTRQLISDQPTVQHVRSYPNSKVIEQISLTQTLTTDSNPNIHFSMNVKLRTSAAPERHSEFKCAVIRGLRCRVEEVTKTFTKPTLGSQHIQADCATQREQEQVSVREICNEKQKGHWSIIENHFTEIQETAQKPSTVDISFGFTIPKNSKPAQPANLSCYAFDPEHLDPDSLSPELRSRYSSTTNERLAIIVEHRLKLDLITGEDTYSRTSQSLVDRKILGAAVNASFPLTLLRKHEGDIGDLVLEKTPPRYEEVPMAPPDYDHFVALPLPSSVY
ncbi:uncharacterized protein N7443_000893 [Penicillium atrosanguineum]|uniref:uncharacterized protein n=1 Tax=Penicillium atrosanguineum TaxID=1132637 RepID=UPI0023A708D1|nr:uncharacterized protein N7443_000893 [Penicillium atrosanguineum]KAJ5314009.1 hypothetical protein N7443_000893 [Penicillium atrosanguineum]